MGDWRKGSKKEIYRILVVLRTLVRIAEDRKGSRDKLECIRSAGIRVFIGMEFNGELGEKQVEMSTLR